MASPIDRDTDLAGGCLCGAVRYRISGAIAPVAVAYCHCGSCRKASGAPVMAWATFPTAAVWLTRGVPTGFAASSRALRQFCPDCGSPLFFTYTEGEPEFDVAVGSLDDPSRIVPDHHIWISSRLPWFETADDLPRHGDDGPDRSSDR